MSIHRPKGTSDIPPEAVGRWHRLEETMRSVCDRYGYGELRTPLFEHTELFLRGVGETSDIVEKEMYTFLDKGDRSITLRPEGTAPVVRAFVETRAYAQAQPTRYYYNGAMFRYSRPQAGRFRQFHQFGAEIFGSVDPVSDAEVILLCMDFFREAGLRDLRLQINSVGCPDCRPGHREALQQYLGTVEGDLCGTCRRRAQENPLRVFDCKSETCQSALREAPVVTRHLCGGCRDHFGAVCHLLDAAGLSWDLDETLVRGLDYYTRTAFEVSVEGIGAQGSIGGGGRYDYLVEEIGGPPTPGVGFAVGLERVLRALEVQGETPPGRTGPDVFLAPVSPGERDACFLLMQRLRQEGIRAQMEVMDRSLKSQFRYADRQGFSHVLVLGEEEAASGRYTLRDMEKNRESVLTEEELLTYLKEDHR